MRPLLNAIFLIFVCTMMGGSAHAYILNIDTIPGELLLDNFDGSSLMARKDVAQKLLNNLNALSASLPDLNPLIISNLDRQKKYIEDSEIKFLTGLKVNSLDKKSINDQFENQHSYDANPDHYLYEVSKEIGFTKSSLKCVLDAKDIKIEMYCWALTSSLLLENAVWEKDIKELIQNQQIENYVTLSDEGMSLKIDVLYRTYHNYGLSILWKIVLPYMNTVK